MNVKKLKFWIKTNSHQFLMLCLLFIPLLIVFWEVYLRFQYELAGPYNWDTPIYWAVGRGILNGYIPWAEMFETKPPGIFLLSSLSFLLFDDVDLTHIVQVLVLGIVLITPALSLIVLEMGQKDRKRTQYLHFWSILTALLFGSIWALYTAERSGEVQVESFGAAFACLYGLTLQFKSSQILFWRVSRLCALTLFILAACGFKEIFLFVILAISLVSISGVKAWMKLFVAPLLLAGALGFGTLWSLGWLDAYVHSYLRFSASTHVNRMGSPWARGLEIEHLYYDSKFFSWGLSYLIIGLVVMSLYVAWKTKFPKMKLNLWVDHESTHLQVKHQEVFFLVVKWALAFYLVSLSIGFVGDFYNHHHVFAIPFVMTLFYVVSQKLKPHLLFAGCTLSILTINPIDYQSRINIIHQNDIAMRAEAKYVDEVLDALNEEQYVFVGHHGAQLYAHTKHSPKGPLFFQYKEFWGINPELNRKFWKNLEETQLVVVMNPVLGRENKRFDNKIEKNFTQKVPANLSVIIRDSRRYKIYFKKNQPELDETTEVNKTNEMDTHL